MIKIHVIGDSTVMSYNSSSYPQMGWGQVLQLYFDNSQVQVENHAIGGRSSRSFHEEGRWTPVRDALTEGDYVFIQFGHNDRDWTKPERYTDTAQFKDYLRIYVKETRDKNAIPVLISPMVLNAWNGPTKRNVFTEGENDYRGAMLEVAEELDVYFIDLNMRSYDLIDSVGASYAGSFIYLGLDPGEYPNFPDGISDGTHFQEMGAMTMSNLLTGEIKALPDADSIMSLKNNLKPTYPLNISKSSPHAGLVTISDEFPEAAHITLKTESAGGYTFLRWEDGQNQTVTEESRIEFTMEAREYTFSAVFEDCAGIEGGSAFLDNCATCIDGVINEEGCKKALEIESACYQSGTLDSETQNDVEIEFTTLSAGTSDTINYAIHASEDGKYKLGIKYLGSTDDQPVDIYVNSYKQAQSMTLSATNNFWQVAASNVPLTRGNNSVTLIFPEVNSDISIDLLTVYDRLLRSGFSCEDTIELLPPLSNEVMNQGDIRAYPMPFNTSFTLQGKNISYSIFGLNGKLIEEGYCKDKCAVGSSLKPGTYLLNVSGQNSTLNRLIIKN